MSFIEQLRMANLYGMGPGNPFTPSKPRMTPLQTLDQFIMRLPRPLSPPLRQPARPARPSAEPPKQNVVYAEALTPYQRAMIEEQRLDRESREKIAEIGTGSREKIAEGTRATRERGLDIQAQRAAVYKWRAENPNMKFLTPKGANYQAVDPLTGEVMDLGVSTGIMTDEENEELRQKGRIALAQERGEQERLTEEERQKGRKENIAAKGREARKTLMLRTSSANLPTQQRVAIYNRAQQVRAEHPEFAKYINLLPGNIVEFKTPKTGVMSYFGGGLSKAEYDAMINLIYGNIKPPTATYSEEEEPETIAPSTTKDPLGIRK